MYCAKCGSINDEDSIFCINCGTNISEQNKKDVKVAKKFDKSKIKNRKILKIIVIVFALLIMSYTIVGFVQYVNNKNNGSGIQGDKYAINVSISSTPSEANVYIDEVFEGKTPIMVDLPEGKYNLKMNITGYKSIKTGLDITYDMYKQDVKVEFEPISNSINTPI